MSDDFDEDFDDEVTDQQVAKLAQSLTEQFGREAPLRAELVARNTLATGDMDAYRLYKRAEGAAEDILFLQGDSGS